MLMWSPLTGSLNKSVHYGLPWIAQETWVNLCTAYLLSRRIMGFRTPAESNLLIKVLMWSAKNVTPKSSWMCMSTRCNGGKAKTLELMHLLLLDMGVSSQPADEARIVHHWTDELLIQHKSVSDRDHSQSLSDFFLTWSIWGNQVSCVSRVTPMSGLCWPSGLAPWRGVLVGVWGRTYKPLRTAWQGPLRKWGSSILSLTVLGHWDMTPGSRQAALACGTWLWWPCHLSKEPTWSGGMA